MTPETHALALLVEERIRTLIAFRRWHRTRSDFLRPYFADMAREDRTELRALLRLRRKARDIARAAEVARTQAVDAGVATWVTS